MKKKVSKKAKNKSFKKMKKKALKMLDWKVLVVLLVVIVVVVGIFIFMRNSSLPDKDLIINDSPDSGSVVIPTPNPAPSFIFKDISLSDAIVLYNKNKNNSKFHIIDVSSDYNSGHIANAVNYPMDSFETSITNLDKTDIYLVYSRDDKSRIAAKIMADNTFENVYRLQGNYGAWLVAGFPVVQ